MNKSLRQSMTWLHTWSGLVVGWVLYFIFVTGTVGYFYVEIDRWMRPELPLAVASASLEQSAEKADLFLREEAADAGYWRVNLPVGRQSQQLDVAWGSGDSAYVGQAGQRTYVPAQGVFTEPITPRATQGGYGLYRMHWKLHYLPQMLGVFVVGFCTMMLLVALITGVIAHKRIFADFFTFRPGKGQRSWLDFHNLMGVLSLPFMLADGSSFPARDLAVFLAAGVIIASLIAATLILPGLLRHLDFAAEPGEEAAEDAARIAAGEAALAAIARAQGTLATRPDDADLGAEAATRVMAPYRQRIDALSRSGAEGDLARRIEALERDLELIGTRAERERLLQLFRSGRLSDEAARKLVREVDLVEARIAGA